MGCLSFGQAMLKIRILKENETVKKWIVFSFLFIVLRGLTACGNGDTVSFTSSGNTGFDSPEEAVVAYLEGLRDADLERMLDAFALETYVENYDFEAVLNRLQAYIPSFDIMMPNVNPFITAINIENRRGFVINRIAFQLLSLSTPEYMDMMVAQHIEEGDAGLFVSAFIERLNAMNLQSIEVLGFIPPEATNERYLSEQNKDSLALQAEALGADQLVSCIVVFSMNGNSYLLMVDAIEYSGRWYIVQFSGNIGALLGLAVSMQGIISIEQLAGMGIDVQALIVPH